MEDNEIINEALIHTNKIHIIPNNNIQLISKGTIKIQTNTKTASGFFLKIKRNKKPFYCLLTNEHVITKDMANNKEIIKIMYDNETKELDLCLDINKRIIVCFKDFLQLDITLVEIIKGDKIKDEFFLLPDINNNKFQNLIKKNLEIVQYPGGEVLSFSGGKIEELDKDNENIFYHTASTTAGSSGSPIVLKGEDKVLAIHRGASIRQNKNIGIFIKDIIDIMKEFTKANLKDSKKVNNNINQFSDFFKKFYNMTEPLVHSSLNILGGRCTRCNHLTSNHFTIENTNDIWQCSECPMDDNICCLKIFNG